MNKKYLVFGLIGIFAMTIVAATIINYYGSIEQRIDIISSILVNGSTVQPMNGYSGGPNFGELFNIKNIAPFPVDIKITNNATQEEIEVEYQGSLMLSQKIANGKNTLWALNETNPQIKMNYTISGSKFNAMIDSPLNGYELIYYKDNSERFNNPATAIAIKDVNKNLPYAEDRNADEYDMCEIEKYTTCHGAKIWYVPSDAISPNGEIKWERVKEFYFETNLIQYNTEGNLTIYSDLDVTPIYHIKNFNGTQVVKTTIA